jgi:hypothetical protein
MHLDHRFEIVLDVFEDVRADHEVEARILEGQPAELCLHSRFGDIEVSGHVRQIRRRGEASSYRAFRSDVEDAVRASEDVQLPKEVEPQQAVTLQGPTFGAGSIRPRRSPMRRKPAKASLAAGAQVSKTPITRRDVRLAGNRASTPMQ